MRWEFEDEEVLLQHLNKIVSDSALSDILYNACYVVEAAAREKTPKDTGALRRSITSEVKANSNTIEGIVYTPLEYAPYIEYGTGLFAEGGGRQDVPWSYQDDEGKWHTTSGIHPQPFLRPALKENKQKIERVIKEGIANA